MNKVPMNKALIKEISEWAWDYDDDDLVHEQIQYGGINLRFFEEQRLDDFIKDMKRNFNEIEYMDNYIII